MSLTSKPRHHHHQKQSSLDSGRLSMDGNEDYTNMSAGSGSHSTSNLHKTYYSDKTRSQPITIQNSSTSQTPKSSSNSISPVYSSLHIGRKYSTGTPPKMFLPLSAGDSPSPSYSSLPRQKTRKISRRDSRESCSSSVTTPSSSSTIFPISLNSPSSPIKNIAKSPEPSGIKVPAAVMNVKYNRTSFVGRTMDRSPCADYTVMDFERTRPKPVRTPTAEGSDYVNYEPAAVIQPTIACIGTSQSRLVISLMLQIEKSL